MTYGHGLGRVPRDVQRSLHSAPKGLRFPTSVLKASKGPLCSLYRSVFEGILSLNACRMQMLWIQNPMRAEQRPQNCSATVNTWLADRARHTGHLITIFPTVVESSICNWYANLCPPSSSFSGCISSFWATHK